MNPENSSHLEEYPHTLQKIMKLLTLKFKVIGSLLLMSGIQGCNQQPSPITETSQKETEGKALIMTVSEPIKFMAERITDESWATILFPADASVVDPAYWNPSPEIIRHYQEADLILLNGGGYAKWITAASLKISRLHDTSSAFKDRFILAEDAVVHQHGPEGKHSHEGYATTTWLDFELAGLHADAVLEALLKQWPAHKDTMQKNHSLLKEDLNQLHRDMLQTAKQIGTTPLLASHPVYQYPAKTYGLNIHSLHWEPDTTPEENEWQALDAFLATTPSQWIIWEDTPTSETQTLLKERKINWVVFRTQGGAPTSGDFLSSMQENLEALKSIKP